MSFPPPTLSIFQKHLPDSICQISYPYTYPPLFVNISPITFAKGDKMLYLCISKGSTLMFPFFVFSQFPLQSDPNNCAKGPIWLSHYGQIASPLWPFHLITMA